VLGYSDGVGGGVRVLYVWEGGGAGWMGGCDGVGGCAGVSCWVVLVEGRRE